MASFDKIALFGDGKTLVGKTQVVFDTGTPHWALRSLVLPRGCLPTERLHCFGFWCCDIGFATGLTG